MLTSTEPFVPSQAAWVFDTRREVVMGTVSAGRVQIPGHGVDPITGRLLMSVTSLEQGASLLVATHRGLKLPQAVRIP